MSGRVWVAAVPLLAGILEKPGWILDGDMEYATCVFFYFPQPNQKNTGTYKHETKTVSFYTLQNSQVPLLADIT